MDQLKILNLSEKYYFNNSTPGNLPVAFCALYTICPFTQTVSIPVDNALLALMVALSLTVTGFNNTKSAFFQTAITPRSLMARNLAVIPVIL